MKLLLKSRLDKHKLILTNQNILKLMEKQEQKQLQPQHLRMLMVKLLQNQKVLNLL